MYFFTSDTIVKANKNIKNLDPKIGGLLCVLHCLTENIEENVSYEINGEKLRKQLSLVFDKDPKDSFENAKSSYIIFARDWISTFFDNYIKNKVDLLSCAVFFLRRHDFERECTKEEVIDIFIKQFNLENYKDCWFCDSSTLELNYNQCAVEDNQSEFYTKMEYNSSFKSILFNGVIQKSAAELKAAGQIQTLYSGSGIHECFLLSDESLDKHYIMSNSNQKCESQVIDTGDIISLRGISKGALTMEDLINVLKDMYNNPESTGKSMTPHLFGFKYGAIIEENNYSAETIAVEAGLTKAYGTEIRKGINIYKAIKNNEYGLSFLNEHAAVAFDYSTTKGEGINKIFYGTPGCGKSYHIEYDILKRDKKTKKYNPDEYAEENVIRTTFYQDYSNTDFVGQILPKIIKGEDGNKDTVEYIFNPGPFTLALIQAISNPTKKVALVVEEINRGNAPAIFGDIFQLLDRDDDSISEYGIVNVGVMDYLNNYTFEVNGKEKRYIFNEIKIPANMYIYATMNTSDQNVYTLDTAFTRRWEKEKIQNSFAQCTFSDWFVPGIEPYTWKSFVEDINKLIDKNIEQLQVNEDKQIGAFFIKAKDLINKDNKNIDNETKKKLKEKFVYKVFDYLWNDVAKLDREVFFNDKYSTLQELIDDYMIIGARVFNESLSSKIELYIQQNSSQDDNNE